MKWALAWIGTAAVTACGGPPITNTHEPAPELVGVWYTVSPGDTVALIASANHVPIEDIIELNGLADPNRVEVGRALFLYGVDELVKRLPQAHGRSPTPSKRPPRFIWPLARGVISSGFGRRGHRMHKGLDIAIAPGAGVHAAAAGTVVYSDNKQRGYGNLVIIRHTGGVMTVYAHNRRNLVDEGDTVRQGARVAEVGSTGHSTGPHLHFEIRIGGKAVDPLVYLPAR